MMTNQVKNTSKSKFWFVPHTNLNDDESHNVSQLEENVPEKDVPEAHRNSPGSVLRKAYSRIDSNTDHVVKNGDRFTILLKSFYVTQDRDKGDNDLFVQSCTRYGTMPHIEVAHFFQEEIPVPYFCHDDLVANHIFSYENHREENRLWLRIQIIEVDGRNVDQIAQFVDAEMHVLMPVLGAVFPGTLPFVANAVDTALDLFGKLKKLVANPNDIIFDEALDLCAAMSGETPFRYGIYVFFSQPVDGSHYQIKQYRIEPVNGGLSGDRPLNIPEYVVLDVLPGIVNPFSQDDIFIYQNLAAGLLPFDENYVDFGEREQRFHYLQSLMKKANLVPQLREYFTLAAQEQQGISLSVSQSNRYRELEFELRDYIELLEEILNDVDAVT